jgi:hypothetical protein
MPAAKPGTFRTEVKIMVPNTMISYTIPTPEPDIFRHSGHAYCPVCEKPVDLLSFGEAARLFRTDRHDIAFLAENRRLHRVHNKAGAVMICTSRSLTASNPERRGCSMHNFQISADLRSSLLYEDHGTTRDCGRDRTRASGPEARTNAHPFLLGMREVGRLFIAARGRTAFRHHPGRGFARH